MSVRTPVLIVGGSLVGLSASLFLAWHGVPAVLIERHPDTSVHPRAKAFGIRTVELFRQVGVEEEIRAHEPAGGMFADGSDVLRVHTLAGEEIGWYPPTHAATWRQGEVSPGRFLVCPQDVLEPILRDRAQALGADLRFGTELVGLTQDADGVTARVHDRTTGDEQTIRADYLIAADGNGSRVRESLGIDTHGAGSFQHDVSVLFDADLSAPLRGRKFFLCYIHHPDATGVLSTDGRRWLYSMPYHPEHGQSPDAFTPQRCVELVRTAVGVPDLGVELLDIQPWSMAAWVADTMRADRVFLAGDSAHVCPPTGGFGANMGVQDAYDLAWKLAYVLRGRAGPGLLDTYEAERLPVARFTVDQAVARFAERNKTAQRPQGTIVPEVGHLAVTIGYRYRSAALPREDGQDHAPCEIPGPPHGRPGTRIPHVWLERDGTRISTLDLVGRDPLLLTGPAGHCWTRALPEVAADLGVRVRAHRIGGDGLTDTTGRWAHQLGLDDSGVVLVRPDGFVSWRARTSPADPHRALRHALARTLAR